MIQIGQKIHCDIEGGRDGVVYAVHDGPHTIVFPTFGFQYTAPSGNTTYDIVLTDGSEARNVPGSAVHASLAAAA